jgi:hypothetical protein
LVVSATRHDDDTKLNKRKLENADRRPWQAALSAERSATLDLSSHHAKQRRWHVVCSRSVRSNDAANNRREAMKTIDTVTATDNTINLDDLARVTGGNAPTNCKEGGCVPQPFPRPSPFPSPFPRPFPGPRDPFGPRNPIRDIVTGGPVR